ncbi:MAG: hypothetical protein K9M07_07035, partial [Simkaniaceae bacterium]|nr:hypothetical protein [Simkaniaceae bacterium]
LQALRQKGEEIYSQVFRRTENDDTPSPRAVRPTPVARSVLPQATLTSLNASHQESALQQRVEQLTSAWEEAKEDYQATTMECNALRSDIESLKRTIQSSEDLFPLCSEQNEIIETLRAQLETTQSEASTLQNQIQKLNARLASAALAPQSDNRSDEMTGDVERLREDHKKIQRELATVEEREQGLKDLLQEHTEQLQTKEIQIQHLTEELQDVSSQLQQAQEHLTAQRAVFSDDDALSELSDHSPAEIERLEELKVALETEISDLRALNSSQNILITSQQYTVDAKQTLINDLKQRLAQMQRQLERKEVACQDAEQRCKATPQIKALSSEIESLQEAKEDLEAQIIELRQGSELEIDSLKTTYTTALNTLEHSSQAQKDKILELKTQLAEMKQDLAFKEHALLKSERQLEAIQAEIHPVLDELRQVEEELKSKEAQLASNRKDMAELISELEGVEKTLHEAQNEFESRLTAQEELVNTLTTENATLKGRVATFEDGERKNTEAIWGALRALTEDPTEWAESRLGAPSPQPRTPDRIIPRLTKQLEEIQEENQALKDQLRKTEEMLKTPNSDEATAEDKLFFQDQIDRYSKVNDTASSDAAPIATRNFKTVPDFHDPSAQLEMSRKDFDRIVKGLKTESEALQQLLRDAIAARALPSSLDTGTEIGFKLAMAGLRELIIPQTAAGRTTTADEEIMASRTRIRRTQGLMNFAKFISTTSPKLSRQ